MPGRDGRPAWRGSWLHIGEVKHWPDMHWPVSLHIHRYNRDRRVSTETYQRQIVFHAALGMKAYEDAIDAQRQTDRCTYFRVQRFAYRPAWRRVLSRP